MKLLLLIGVFLIFYFAPVLTHSVSAGLTLLQEYAQKHVLTSLVPAFFIAGILEVVLPQEVVTSFVGKNTLVSNLIASLFGALMYFATLTEVPIIQKLMALGMAKGPALTLLLTGNALSLPSVIVLVKIMGPRQATVYIVSVVLLSAVAGLLLGAFI